MILSLAVEHVHLLLVQDVRRNEALLVAELACERLRSSKWHWLWAQVLVWVETTKGNDVSEACELDHWLRLHWAEVGWADRLAHHHWLTIERLTITGLLLVGPVVLELLWHWWESHSFWKIWKRIDELSSFDVGMEERATISELAFTSLEPVSAWLSLVIGVDST